MEKKNQIVKYLKSSREEMIDLQRLLTSIPAVSPESGGSGELSKAKALEGWLKEKGFENIKWYNARDKKAEGGIRPNMIVEIPGKKHEKRFWIMSHIDVVPPGELSLWETDPFRLEVKGDKIFGRGVEDNQQGLTASVFAALSLISNSITPEYDVSLLFVADEEMGSQYGIKYLLDNYDLFGENDFVLVPDSGDPDGKLIEIAEKNVLWLKVTTKGKQCHASRPDLGRNAFAASSEMVYRLKGFEKSLDESNPIFEPPRTTVTPTKKEANVPNINTLPGEDVFYIDCRILPETGIEKVYSGIERIAEEIEKKYGVSIQFDKAQEMASRATPENSGIVDLVKASVKEVYGVDAKCIGIGGGTVAAYLRNRGIDAVVWGRIDETAHMPNEYCRLGNLEGDSIVMAFLMAGHIL